MVVTRAMKRIRNDEPKDTVPDEETEIDFEHVEQEGGQQEEQGNEEEEEQGIEINEEEQGTLEKDFIKAIYHTDSWLNSDFHVRIVQTYIKPFLHHFPDIMELILKMLQPPEAVLIYFQADCGLCGAAGDYKLYDSLSCCKKCYERITLCTNFYIEMDRFQENTTTGNRQSLKEIIQSLEQSFT